MTGGGKRKNEGGGGGKNKKAKYMNQSNNSNPALPQKSRGFLVSCPSGKERQASFEAIHVLQSYYEAGLAEKGYKAGEAASSTEEDIGAKIDKEFAALRDPEQQIFSNHKTGISGLCFIVMKDGVSGPSPAEILVAIAEEVRTTKQSKTRLCMRFTPVDTVCRASLDDMRKAARSVVLPHFPKHGQPKTFAVNYDHRASANLDRATVINTVLEGVAQPPHKANLKAPELSILVEVMKNVCAVGVAPRYREFAKFNFKELCTADEKVEEEGGKGGEEKPDANVLQPATKKPAVAADDHEASKADAAAAEEPSTGGGAAKKPDADAIGKQEAGKDSKAEDGQAEVAVKDADPGEGSSKVP